MTPKQAAFVSFYIKTFVRISQDRETELWVLMTEESKESLGSGRKLVKSHEVCLYCLSALNSLTGREGVCPLGLRHRDGTDVGGGGGIRLLPSGDRGPAVLGPAVSQVTLIQRDQNMPKWHVLGWLRALTLVNNFSY